MWIVYHGWAGCQANACAPLQHGEKTLGEVQPLIRCRLTAPHPLRGQTRFAVCPIRLTAPQAARPSGGRRRLWRESTPPFGGVPWWVGGRGHPHGCHRGLDAGKHPAQGGVRALSVCACNYRQRARWDIARWFGVWEGYARSHGSLMPISSAFPCTPRMRGAALH